MESPMRDGGRKPPDLNDDVLIIVMEELGCRRDFGTLFNCALTGRRLSESALKIAYREHHAATARGGYNEAAPIAEQQQVVQKWAILWRSIIASSVDAKSTLYPYSRYCRALDLRDFQELLEDKYFTSELTNYLFAGPLSGLRISLDTPVKRQGLRRAQRLNMNAITLAAGDAITQHCPVLESLSGRIDANSLLNWAPRLPSLRSLDLWDGTPFDDELARSAILENCPNLSSLMILLWVGDDRDHKLASLIGGMRPQQLSSLEILHKVGLGAEAFLALGAHHASLKRLNICFDDTTFQHLSLLSPCTALESIRFEEDIPGIVNLEENLNGVFTEVQEWLNSCTSLKELELSGMESGPSLVLPLLGNPSVRLRKLGVEGYYASNNRKFHQALSSKTTLESLSLTGEAGPMVRDDVDALVDSLSSMQGLRDLNLRGVSDYLTDAHFNGIFLSLRSLVDIYVTGLRATDQLFEGLSGLKHLRNISLNVASEFTFDGLKSFASGLSEGNQGITFSVDLADNTAAYLSEEQIATINNLFASKVGGRFDYTLMRDPNVPEFEGESD